MINLNTHHYSIDERSIHSTSGSIWPPYPSIRAPKSRLFSSSTCTPFPLSFPSYTISLSISIPHVGIEKDPARRPRRCRSLGRILQLRSAPPRETGHMYVRQSACPFINDIGSAVRHDGQALLHSVLFSKGMVRFKKKKTPNLAIEGCRATVSII